MTDNQETSADIIAEIRALSNPISDGIIAINGRSIADRLEAAIRREKAAIEADALAVGGMVGAAHRRELSKNVSKNGADFGQLGDCAKLREVLKRAWLFITATRESFAYVHKGLIERDKLCDDIDAALSAPPRNCDVGTAEEQYKRFMNMCNSKDARQCAGCSMRGFTPGCSRDRCFANWAQMPYVEKEGGGR